MVGMAGHRFVVDDGSVQHQPAALGGIFHSEPVGGPRPEVTFDFQTARQHPRGVAETTIKHTFSASGIRLDTPVDILPAAQPPPSRRFYLEQEKRR